MSRHIPIRNENEEDGVPIQIIREVDEEEDEEYDEEDISPPFPQVDERSTLRRTSQVDLSKYGKRTAAADNSNQSRHEPRRSARRFMKSVKTGTLDFLGVESTPPSQPPPPPPLPAIASTSRQVDTTDNANLDRSTSKQSTAASKTLTNWDERTFRIMNSNPIFGGKLKPNKIERFVNNVDEKNVDLSDPFLFYKLNGYSYDLNRSKQKLTVGKAATNGLKRVISKKKPGDDKKTKETYEPGVSDPLMPAGRQLYRVDVDGVDAEGMPGQPRVLFSTPAVDETDRPSPDEEENIEGPCDAFTHACSGDRTFGVGFCGRLLDNYLDPTKKPQYEELLTSVRQHRPYFTYWITFVQIAICLMSIFAYSLAPIGLSYSTKRGLSTMINLEKQLISYPIKQNFWIGPAFSDLVHLGAKYAPCMRNDTNIHKAIEKDRLREKDTACCIRNDKGGCVQTNEEQCSSLFSHWHKWNQSTYQPEIPSAMNRTSGSVCGLDPSFCNDIDSQKWPDDITNWPLCDKPASFYNTSIKKNEHMFCELIGRPCCIGLQGECVITTLDHCNMMRGYFHERAHLCSQVDCLQDVCGMIDFLNPKSPDQVYRLFTSIFIHAGILQLLVTIVFQIFVLRDVEKLAGSLRVGIVYTASGVIGNLGSAVFLPYQAEVGPMGSQFGIIACLFVEVFHAWGIYMNPWLVLLKLTGCLIVLLAIGFLPMIDNFANIFGFISGFLLASILFPNINLRGQCRRLFIIFASIGITVALSGALVVLFYYKPIEKCDWCKFISCPFGPKYCLDTDFNVTRISR